jgi:hypothetical protein
MLANFTTDSIKALFRTAVNLQPAIAEKMRTATSTQDVEQIFREAVGVIDAQAGTGAISIDGALLAALRGIRFDHAHGTVSIGNTTVKAPVFVTGGQAGATGTTTVEGNTRLKSQGTQIDVGKGAQIKLTGNAQIKQT